MTSFFDSTINIIIYHYSNFCFKQTPFNAIYPQFQILDSLPVKWDGKHLNTGDN